MKKIVISLMAVVCMGMTGAVMAQTKGEKDKVQAQGAKPELPPKPNYKVVDNCWLSVDEDSVQINLHQVIKLHNSSRGVRVFYGGHAETLTGKPANDILADVRAAHRKCLD